MRLVLLAAGLGILACAVAFVMRARLRHQAGELQKAQGALKKMSSDLTVAQGVAAQANQAKSAFLAAMSHELRTPLNAVIGFSDTMMQEAFGPLAGRYREYAKDINSSGAHLLGLINDVLDLSRMGAGLAKLQEEELDLNDVIADLLPGIAEQAIAGQIALIQDIAPGLPLLRADRRRVQRILSNLVSNALKYTPANGRVGIHAHLANGALVLMVTDSGIGIAPEDIDIVLEAFGQVDSFLARKHEGTGLGLPLARQLTELHGGSLILESTVNAGTTVTVTLPAQRLVVRDRAAA